jgi:hypothetical protein
LGIDLGYIKTILCHAAAVHWIVVSTQRHKPRPHRIDTTRPRRKG